MDKTFNENYHPLATDLINDIFTTQGLPPRFRLLVLIRLHHQFPQDYTIAEKMIILLFKVRGVERMKRKPLNWWRRSIPLMTLPLPKWGQISTPRRIRDLTLPPSGIGIMWRR